MTNDVSIRTRRDGSIDTAYYMEKGRLARSRQAHRITRHTARKSASILPALTGVAALLILLLPFAI